MADGSPSELPRRGLLVLTAGSLAVTAGCLGDDTDGGDDNSSGNSGDQNGSDRNSNADKNPNGDPDGDQSGDRDGDANGDPENGGQADPQPQGHIQEIGITGQSAPATVGPTDSLLATATLANTGEGEGEVSLTVRLRRADGPTIAEADQTTTLAADRDTTIQLTGEDDALLGRAVRDAAPGTYELVVTSDGDGQTAQVTVQISAMPALSELSLGDTPITTDATELQPSVTIANDGDLPGEFDIVLQIAGASTDSDEFPREASTSQQVTPGAQARVTLPVDVSDLNPGEYPVTVTATPTDAPESDRRARVSTTLPVKQAPASLSATVYTRGATDEHTAMAGTLRVTDQRGETVAEHDLAESASVTFDEGIANNERYTVATENIDEGVYPDGETTVTVDGETNVELVTAYEFQGAESFRFSVYGYADNGRDEDGSLRLDRSYYCWGTHAANADHFATWQTSLAGGPAVDGQIHNHGADLSRNRFHVQTTFSPIQQVKIGDELYSRVWWPTIEDQTDEWQRQPPEEYAFYPRNRRDDPKGTPLAFRPLIEITNADPDNQQFIGERELDGETVHAYELTLENFPGPSTVYVEPDTGYVVRWQASQSEFGIDDDGRVIYEFTDYGQIDSLSIDELDLADPQPPV